MASCIICAGRKLKRDRHGRRKCKRHGYMPGFRQFDRGGNLPMDRGMTPNDIEAELKAIAKMGGNEQASAALFITSYGHPSLTFYPHGVVKSERVHMPIDPAKTIMESIIAFRQKISADLGAITQNRIRELAIAIIDKTAAQGKCTPEMLRAAGFTPVELGTMLDDALAAANRIVCAGPFAVEGFPS